MNEQISPRGPGTPEPRVLDDVDRAIIAALHDDGRAPWSRLAEVTGVSASTVRRRYESLHARGVVRVIGATDALRLGLGHPVYMRFSRALDDLELLIPRLQSRPEVRFCATVLGSTDLVADLVVPSLADVPALTLDLTAGTRSTAETLLITHTFTTNQVWIPPFDSSEPTHSAPVEARPGNPVALSRVEATILEMLMRDGRAPLSDLAQAVDRSENTAARAIDNLRSAGLLAFRILVEPPHLGFSTEFMLWLEVEPRHVNEVAHALAEHPNTKYLTTTTGRTNLTGQVALRNDAELFRYSTEVLGGLPGIRSSEIAVQVATHKRVWTALEHGRYTTAGKPLALSSHRPT